MLGDRGQEVAKLHAYLSQFGYLPNAALQRTYGYSPPISEWLRSPETYDEITRKAVLAFQAFYGLPREGTVNERTLQLIRTPRCGVPDRVSQSQPSRYVLSGYKWPFNNPAWAGDAYGSPANSEFIRLARQAMRNAVGEWAGYSNMKPVPNTGDVPQSSPIYYCWHPGNSHRGKFSPCPMAFESDVLAHASYPDGGDHAGEIHFNTAIPWAADGSAFSVDIESVTLHELGHALGLAHTAHTEAVMFAYLSLGTIKRKCAADDIDGIRQIYGGG
jgi:peptidoglycan hydrolase-like protein with peptidoglycan-binding domain